MFNVAQTSVNKQHYWKSLTVFCPNGFYVGVAYIVNRSVHDDIKDCKGSFKDSQCKCKYVTKVCRFLLVKVSSFLDSLKVRTAVVVFRGKVLSHASEKCRYINYFNYSIRQSPLHLYRSRNTNMRLLVLCWVYDFRFSYKTFKKTK